MTKSKNLKRKSTQLILSILLISSSLLTAQKATIQGKVWALDSTAVLSGVSVYLEGTNIGASTNSSGQFSIEEVSPGQHWLVASALGYTTEKQSLVLKAGETIVVDFVLEERVLDFPQVTITGGKSGMKDIPGAVHYISPKEIEKFRYTDINRTLRTVSGVNIQEEDGFGLFPNIGLRGTGVERSSKITLMEDGILMAPAPYAAPAAYYFPTMGRMQGIEIVKGSSQIKYGPYTTGGAINLISTQIPEVLSGKVSMSTGSFGFKEWHAHIGNSQKHFDYLIESFQYGSNGFKELDEAQNIGKDTNTGFDKKDYLAKFRIHTAADAKVHQSLSFKIGQATTRANETYLGLTKSDFEKTPYRRYAASQLDQINTRQRQFSILHSIEFSKALRLNTTVYRSDFKRNWYKLDRLIDSTGNKVKIAELLKDPQNYPELFEVLNGSTSHVGALWVKANNRKYYAQGIQTKLNYDLITDSFKHQMELGLRLHQDQIDRFQWFDKYAMEDSIMKLSQAGTHGTESNRVETSDAFAAYLQHKFQFKKLYTTVGIRYEHISQERVDYGKNDPMRTAADTSVRSNIVQAIMPGIGILYRHNYHLSAFIGIHKGFAPPGSKSGLLPEQSINYEWGARYLNRGLSVLGVLFFNDYANLLGTDLQAGSGGGTNEQFNGGSVHTKGLELNMRYDFLASHTDSDYALPFALAYTYTQATFQNDFDSDFGAWGKVSAGDHFPYLPNHQLGLSIALEHPRFEINLSGKYMAAMRTKAGQGALEEDVKTDAYFVIDAALNYQLHKGISLFAQASNLSNQVYAVATRPAGWRPGMPRSFKIGLEGRF